MEPLPEVIAYYERFAEESRLDSGPSRLEFERTKEILARVLPKPPARLIDVGGAAGVYSAWLAERGYETHLVDASPRLVERARQLNAALEKPIASLSVADARRLPQDDRFAAAVLLMGPLYHLPSEADRNMALIEALRVLEPSGLLVVAAISRYASALDGLARRLAVDPAFVRMRDQDLRDGQHRNDTSRLDYFTTSYFHRPEDLRRELEVAGCEDVRLFGVEGPGWIVSDFEDRWADGTTRADILNVARALESEPSVIGASAHLLAIGRKPGGSEADPYDLARFIQAQESDYDQAMAEIRSGRKQSHWMWYIFPQFDGLGFSSTSRQYAIKSLAEAEAYLRHPVLGPRLRDGVQAVLGIEGRSALEIFGSPDHMKLRSCATLFACVSPAGSVFERILDRYFDGERDDKTLRLVGRK